MFQWRSRGGRVQAGFNGKVAVRLEHRVDEETAMKVLYFLTLASLGVLGSHVALADREPGWDYGADIIYQDSQDISFTGGSSVSLDNDVGIALAFGYRFNERFELTFGLDWNTVDYDFDVASGSMGILGFSGSGDLESWTPSIGLNVNILEGDFTPYVNGSVGWAFIDTNIPDAPPETACWWDPWWGYYCGTFQSTRSIDELTYDLGIGVRWDVTDVITLRFGYERHWIDIGEANSTPGLDQVKLGIAARY
jgi:opacity protein-like surface antigen